MYYEFSEMMLIIFKILEIISPILADFLNNDYEVYFNLQFSEHL